MDFCVTIVTWKNCNNPSKVGGAAFAFPVAVSGWLWQSTPSTRPAPFHGTELKTFVRLYKHLFLFHFIVIVFFYIATSFDFNRFGLRI
jgi:hypothetical protein